MLRYLFNLFIVCVIVPCCLAEWCGHNYCGSGKYCCDRYHSECCYDSNASIGVWAGIAVTALIVGGIIVTIAICCCNKGCPLYRRYRGQVIRTNAPGTAVVTTYPAQQPYVQTVTQGYPQSPPVQPYAQAQPYPQAQPSAGQGYQQPQPAGYTPTQTGYSNQGYTAEPPAYEEVTTQRASAPAQPPPYNPDYHP